MKHKFFERDNIICREVISILNEKAKYLNERDYRRLLRLLIKKLYVIRNINWNKKKVATDFTLENNPKKKSHHLVDNINSNY